MNFGSFWRDAIKVMNMISDQRLSSSLRCRIDSLMRLISFLPLCSPCLTFIFVMTLRHPASTFSFASSSLFIDSFLMFSAALSIFSCSFLALYSSSCLRPSAFRASLSCHSRSYLSISLRSFIWECSGCVPPPHGYAWWSHLPRNHWSRSRPPAQVRIRWPVGWIRRR